MSTNIDADAHEKRASSLGRGDATGDAERIRSRLESVTEELRDVEDDLGEGLSVREAIHHLEAVDRAVSRLEGDEFAVTDGE